MNLNELSGRLHYGLKPVPGADWSAFDRRRLRDYFTRVLQGDAPEDTDHAGRESLLRNMDFMTDSADSCAAAVDGLLLFGSAPQRFLPEPNLGECDAGLRLHGSPGHGHSQQGYPRYACP